MPTHYKSAKVMVVLLIASVFDQLVGLAFYPLLPDLQDSLQATHDGIKFLVPCYLSGFIFAQIMVGFLSAQFGGRHIFLAGLLVVSCSALICSMANTLDTLLIGFFGQAVGIGFVLPLQNSIVRHIYKGKQEARIFGITNIALCVGGIFAPIIGGGIGSEWGWRWLFGLLSMLGAVILIISFFLLFESSEPKKPPNFSGGHLLDTLNKLLKNTEYCGALVVFGFLGSATAAFSIVAPFVLKSIYGIETHFIGMVLAIPTVGKVAGLIISSLLIKFLIYRSMIIIGISITIISTLSLLFLNGMNMFSVETFIGSIFVLYVGFGFATPSIWTSALNKCGTNATLATSFLILGQNFFSIITTSVIACEADIGVTFLVSILFFLATVSLVLYIFITKKRGIKSKVV